MFKALNYNYKKPKAVFKNYFLSAGLPLTEKTRIS